MSCFSSIGQFLNCFLKITDETVCELWINALRLICDDNSQVRLKAGLLCEGDTPAVPLKSLEIMLDSFSSVMDCCPPFCLATLLAISLGPLPDSSNYEADEVTSPMFMTLICHFTCIDFNTNHHISGKSV